MQGVDGKGGYAQMWTRTLKQAILKYTFAFMQVNIHTYYCLQGSLRLQTRHRSYSSFNPFISACTIDKYSVLQDALYHHVQGLI